MLVTISALPSYEKKAATGLLGAQCYVSGIAVSLRAKSDTKYSDF